MKPCTRLYQTTNSFRRHLTDTRGSKSQWARHLDSMAVTQNCACFHASSCTRDRFRADRCTLEAFSKMPHTRPAKVILHTTSSRSQERNSREQFLSDRCFCVVNVRVFEARNVSAAHITQGPVPTKMRSLSTHITGESRLLTQELNVLEVISRGEHSNPEDASRNDGLHQIDYPRSKLRGFPTPKVTRSRDD